MGELKQVRVRTRSAPVESDPQIDPAPTNDVDHRVGYKNPPRHTRFKPGQSGNPRGRPKGSRSLAACLASELDQRITVREQGRVVRMKKRDLIAKQLVKKGAEGDLKAVAHIVRIEGESERRTTTLSEGVGADPTAAFTPERDAEILAQFRALCGGADDIEHDVEEPDVDCGVE